MGELAPTVPEARALAEEAYVYGFALVENYRAMFGMCVWRDSPQFSGFNHYLHARQLFDASYETVVNANNDTLYSTTFADLRAEPVALTLPRTGNRYFVVQLVDMSTDNFAYLGTRATGTEGGDFLLVGPRFQGVLPDPARFRRVVVAPSEFVALATRTAIDGPDDLGPVVEVQEGLRIRPLSAVLGTTTPPPPPEVDFPVYEPDLYGSPALLGLLNFLLGFHTVPGYEADLLRRLGRIGVGPYRDFDLGSFAPAVQQAIADGCRAGHERIEQRGTNLGRVVRGWQDIPAMGRYGTDYLFRSAVAWKFIYTNSPEEALYPIAETDASGAPLTGEHRYLLRFPPGGLPPVQAFWSLTLYDGVTRLMVDNPINRYSIGDRTPGLRYDEDGALTIAIQHEPPAATGPANWLPAPAGRFYLNVRAYLPEQTFIDGRYRLPAVVRVDEAEQS